MFNILYTVFIGPLKTLFEFIFTVSYFLTNNGGLSILFLSLSVNFLLMPLYKKANEIQEKENEKQESMREGIDHIKKNFKGDERYMILNTYYRQNNYKQIYSLKNLISLLLEIPFFIAAYNYLSNLQVIKNMPFGPIVSLGLPDGLLNGINILPILMTLINILSCIVFAKGQKNTKNFQLYFIAILFFILLYNAPSGLVLYYLFNNLFSLIKNIVNNNKLIGNILCYVSSAVSVIGIIYFLLNPLGSVMKTLCVIVVLLVPLLLLITKLTKISWSNSTTSDSIKTNYKLFFILCMCICILIGLYIPSQLIDSSVSEFIDTTTFTNPNEYIFNTFLLSFGTFVVWFNVYYSLMNKRIKRVLLYLVACLLAIGTINYMFFGTNMGFISKYLVYEDNTISFSSLEIIINSLVLIVLCYIVSIIIKHKRVFNFIILAVLLSFLTISSLNIININAEYKETAKVLQNAKVEEPSFTLSKNGNNVIVITLDRFVSMYFPYILEEIPGLKEKFEGFTYYPNTVSFGAYTKAATPALYGGYEYMPINLRDLAYDELIEKHNEALKVMPVLFSNNGFNVTVCDLPYANYKRVTDLSIFDDYDGIDKYIADGYYKIEGVDSKRSLSDLNQLLFLYSIMKSSPLVFQGILYNQSAFNKIDYYNEIFDTSISDELISSYAVLENLETMTNVSVDSSVGGVMIMHNYTSHGPAKLNENGYELTNDEEVNKYTKNRYYEGNELIFENDYQYKFYAVDAASLILLGDYFDYLRDVGVYDNTRIIITSDHGGQFFTNIENFSFGEENNSLIMYNAFLLVKDYDSKISSIDQTFMSNADVVYLATNNIIENPINPFTGNKISNDYKKNGLEICMTSSDNVEGSSNIFSFNNYYLIEDNIFNPSNWKKISKNE